MVSSVTVLALLASALVAVVHADFHVFGQQGTIYLYYEDGTDIITSPAPATTSAATAATSRPATISA
jgi:hypothetical protein